MLRDETLVPRRGTRRKRGSKTRDPQEIEVSETRFVMKTPNTNIKVYDIATTAMMICIIMVSIALFRIPIPFTQGYVNLSDAMVFMAVIILGWKYGAVAAGMGSLLGDLLSGFPMWAPWSLVIKACMALIFGMIIQSACARRAVGTAGGARLFGPAESRTTADAAGTRSGISSRRFLTVEILGMIVAGLFMCAGYYFAEGIMYGNWVVALLGIPWNIGQFALGTVLAVVLNRSLGRTSLRSVMAYCAPTVR